MRTAYILVLIISYILLSSFSYDNMYYHINDDATLTMVKNPNVGTTSWTGYKRRVWTKAIKLPSFFWYNKKLNQYETINENDAEYKVVNYGEYALSEWEFWSIYTQWPYPDELDYREEPLIFPETLISFDYRACYKMFIAGTGIDTTVIRIPSNVISIGEEAFAEMIRYPNGKHSYHFIFGKALQTIGKKAFYNTDMYGLIDIREADIGEKAFALKFDNGYSSHNCSIKIGKGVRYIGAKAFYLRPISEITLDISPFVIIDEEAFYCRINNCAIVHVNLNIPVYLPDNAFNPKTYNEGTLYVPIGCANKYRNAPGWKQFKNIVEEFSSLDGLSVDKSPVVELERYTINGIKIKNPISGTNIIRFSDGTTQKVMIK